MARARKLKVYRTPIGFHDAYVAAPSRKAALEAWGTDRDLFARGIAEEVNDPELGEAPLASPGVVIKRSRGTTAEQIAALPKDRPKADRKSPSSTSSGDGASAIKSASKPRTRPTPKPGRDALAAAEERLAEAEQRQQTERDALTKRERELARERGRLERNQAQETERLQRQLDTEREAYDRAIQAWRG